MDQPYEPPSWFVNSVRILTARSPEFRDFVEVIPNLFLGSHPDGHDPFAIGARVVVCLSSRASVEAAPSDGMFLHWPIQDGPLPDEATLRQLARFIADSLGRSLTVFVHCDAGLNRSALLVAQVLVERGMPPADAVRLIRARRRGSLSNTYETWLLSQT
jgi:hypothetical protein